jgi:large repetitive protein
MLVSLAVILTLVGVALVVLSGAEAVGQGQPQCGDTITADTTLHEDLLNCPNNGIVIGADNITLDLSGHTIDGDGQLVKKCPRSQICDVGIFNDGHDRVTVRNGSAREFATGVLVANANRNEVVGISSSRNFLFGIILVASAQSVVRDSSGSDNPAPEGDGLGLFGSHDIRIVDNTFRANGLGMHVEDSTDNLISGNVFARNQPGILMEADRNEVRRNRCLKNAACILITAGSRGNVVARNHIVEGGDGVGIENSRGNLVADNDVLRVRKIGIYIGLNRPPLGGADNVLRGNVVRESGDDGFRVTEKASQNRLAHNVATGAGDDGFDIKSRSTKLTGDRAQGNADLGIEAVRGVSDSGGNRAKGNGDPRQCTNIVCR